MTYVTGNGNRVLGHLKSAHFLVSAMIILLTIIPIIAIGPIAHIKNPKKISGATVTYETCRVLSVIRQSLKPSPYSANIPVGSQVLEIKMLSGTHKGQTLHASNYLSTDHSVVARKGSRLTVVVDELNSGKFKIRVHNYHRAPYIYAFAALFLLTMVVVSGKKGIMSCLSLIYTFTCIVFLFLPLVMMGYSAVLSAIGLVILVISANMIFLNGVSKKTYCAIAGTACGVMLSGIILIIFSRMVHITGFNLKEVESLLFIRQKTGLRVEDLLFAGILIASMGAVMDTALSIVSAIYELQVNRPDLGAMNLFMAGMNVGKDMIGTMSNTLILAFAGAALSTVIILSFYSTQYNQFINSNFVALEIAQALSGSMAVVLTIPLTAAIAAKMLATQG